MRECAPILRIGARLIWEIPPGADVTFFRGMPIVVAPGERPYTFREVDGYVVRHEFKPGEVVPRA